MLPTASQQKSEFHDAANDDDPEQHLKHCQKHNLDQSAK
jgi:hypothetical protein